MPVPMSSRDIDVFFRFARTLNGFRWNLREIIITTDRWAGYIFGRNCTRDKGAGYDRTEMSVIFDVACSTDADRKLRRWGITETAIHRRNRILESTIPRLLCSAVGGRMQESRNWADCEHQRNGQSLRRWHLHDLIIMNSSTTTSGWPGHLNSTLTFLVSAGPQHLCRLQTLQYFIWYSSMLSHLPFWMRRGTRSRHVLLHSLPPRPPPDYTRRNSRCA